MHAMNTNKPRVVKDYEKLDETLQEQIKLIYPYGFEKHLVTFINREGKKVSALPFEAEDKYYLVRMTVLEARDIILEDDDYDDDGNLRDEVRDEYDDKYSDDDDDDDVDDDDSEVLESYDTVSDEIGDDSSDDYD